MIPPAARPNLIAVYKVLPKELFRVNNGPIIHLRDKAQVQAKPSQRPIYDIASVDGRVIPKALDAVKYQAPNGASMRPNSPYQQQLVSSIFHGSNRIVYAVPAGTHLPHDLIMVHERTDHFSLQPAKEMMLEDLNFKITDFLVQAGRLYTREEWIKAYPKATEYLDLPKSNRR